MSSTNYLPYLLREYLKLFGIFPKSQELYVALQSSPSYPSVLSIVQTCNYFGLSTKAFKADYNALLKSKIPAIVLLKDDSDEKFALVENVSVNSVVFKDTAVLRTIEMNPDEFCKQWTGILVLSEGKKEKEKNVKNKINIKKNGTITLLLIAVLTILSFSIQNPTVFLAGLFFLKFMGIWLTYNLIRHEIGVLTPLLENFCRMKVSFDCEKVLSSKMSRLFNTIHLSDSGFFYFLTGFLMLVLSIFSGVENSILFLLFYLSVCATPLILFSILYQKMIVKKWCPICLSVAGIIFLEICLFLFYPDNISSFNSIQPFFICFFAFFASLLILNFSHRFLQAQKKAIANKVESLKIKRNPLVLTTIFNQQKSTLIPQNQHITVGNQDAPIIITTLLNPICQPCAKMAKSILTLLEKQSTVFLWQIRFDGIETKQYHPINHMQLHLMQLCNNETEDDKKLQVIKDWYRMQSIKKFVKKYPFKGISEETIRSFAEQNSQNKLLNVQKVPTLWMNNKQLPEDYSVTDLPFLSTNQNLLLQLTK